MTEIDDIMAALQDIDKELEQWQKAQALVPPIDSVAINLLTNGSPYFIGLKERSEDLIPNILMWIASQEQDHAIKGEGSDTTDNQTGELQWMRTNANDIDKDGAGMGQERLPAKEGANEDEVDNEEADEEAVANNRANDKEADDQAGDEEVDEVKVDKDEADKDEGKGEEVDDDGDEDADKEEGLEGDYNDEDDEMGEEDDVEDDKLHGF
ncbi:hypothetical protein FRC06_011425 [Ceratobasidium sp. 370]|nr:hypothetical protein FRC06_011425 [Ceratobasidium sp. 370]